MCRSATAPKPESSSEDLCGVVTQDPCVQSWSRTTGNLWPLLLQTKASVPNINSDFFQYEELLINKSTLAERTPEMFAFMLFMFF